MEAKEIYERLSDIVKPVYLEIWWRRKNPSFEDQIPSEMAKTEEGRKRLQEMLYRLESGMPG